MSDSSIRDDCREFWERCFAEYPFDFSRLSPGVMEPVISKLRFHRCRRVLDLGCGFGKWSVALTDTGFDVTAVDLADAAIGWLRRWIGRDHLTIETVVSWPQDFVRHEFFDAVICRSVLDHMPMEDAIRTMENIAESLRTGGVCCLSFDGVEEDPDLFEILSDGTRRYLAGRRRGMLWRFYSDDEIRTICAPMSIIEMNPEAGGRRTVWLERHSSSSR